jgi:aspartate racemase
MKSIGLIGGLSWVSTIDYYRFINEQVNQRLGGTEAGKILLYSVNFGEIKKLTAEGNWPVMTDMMCSIAQKLEQAGADCLLIGANTMHKIADAIQAAISIPIIHIAEVTARAVNEQGLKKVALMGTKYTMELDFYPKALAAYGIEMIIPGEDDRDYIHHSIYEELGKNIFTAEAKSYYQQIIQRLAAKGAEGVILGCTEIPLLISPADSPIPIFNTAFIQSCAAVDFALS